jgi:uncharacterized phage protein (TIGR01671 family)
MNNLRNGVIYLTERYLFRAKKFGNSGFIYGNYAQYNHNGLKGDYIINACGIYRIKPGTVGQCTGLRDKNENLIFEGDVVKYIHKDDKAQNITTVCFENYGWSLKNTALPFSIFAKTEMEIIGNIYDNPEMVEMRELDAIQTAHSQAKPSCLPKD